MRRLLFPATIMLALSSSMQAEVKQSVVIHTTDGAEVAFDLVNVPTVRFDSDNLIIRTDELSIEYPLSLLSHIDYRRIDTDAVSSPESDTAKQPFIVGEDEIIFSELSKGSSVLVSGVDGRVLYHTTLKTSDNLRLPLSFFAPGLYLVTVNQVSYKIIVR